MDELTSETCWAVNNEIIKQVTSILDFKLSPCSICNMFPFGLFPGVWVLIADVSEPSISYIFIGRWMKYLLHLPMKMERIEGSETSAIRTQTPGNYPKENVLQVTSSWSLFIQLSHLILLLSWNHSFLNYCTRLRKFHLSLARNKFGHCFKWRSVNADITVWCNCTSHSAVRRGGGGCGDTS